MHEGVRAWECAWDDVGGCVTRSMCVHAGGVRAWGTRAWGCGGVCVYTPAHINALKRPSVCMWQTFLPGSR